MDSTPHKAEQELEKYKLISNWSLYFLEEINERLEKEIGNNPGSENS